MGNVPPKLKSFPDGIKNLYMHLDEKKKKQVDVLIPNLSDEAVGVLIKILGSDALAKRVGGKIKEASDVFSSIPKLKKLYLNTDWHKDQFGDEEEIQQNNESFNLSSKAQSSEIGNVEQKLETIGEKYRIELTQTFKTVKIKLIIAEVAHTKEGRGFRQLISPVLSKFDWAPEFGMFHSALQIGPWILDWNDSAIVIPRKCVSQAALISADIGEICSEKKLDDIIDELAKAIAHWNSKMLYKDKVPRSLNEGNCQDFVNDVLTRLGVKVNFEGPLGAFVKKLKEEGKCKICFEMDGQFREEFNIKEKSIEFKTHLELDKFVENIFSLAQEKRIDLQKTYPDHMSLLKSFDRAFWLRHYKFRTDPKYFALADHETCYCPFKDPETTGSIIQDI